MSATRDALARLVEHGPATSPEIAQAIGLSVDATSKALMNLRQRGFIEAKGRVARTPGMKKRGNPPMLWQALPQPIPSLGSVVIDPDDEHPLNRTPVPQIIASAIARRPALATVWMPQEAQ